MQEFDNLYFVDSDLKQDCKIDLPSEEHRHFSKVKRAKKNEIIHLTNGRGQYANGKVILADGNRTRVQIAHEENILKPRKMELYLAPALLKKTHFEWLLEKSTELGIDHIVPLISKRIVADKPKYDRWEKIIISSIKQSKNFWKPILHKQIDLINLKSEFPDVKWICFHEKASINLNKDIFDDFPEKIGIVIGPEGGFTDEEVNCFEHIFLLTSTRLRAETAAITAINQIDLLYRWIFPPS